MFKNPFLDPNMSLNGKTAEERARELIREQKRKELEARWKGRDQKSEEQEEQIPDEQNDQLSPSNERVVDAVDFLMLSDVECVDATGSVFEKYREILVAKDIIRNADKSQVNFTPYKGAKYFQDNPLQSVDGNSLNMFLPSFALSCNIVARLYDQKSDPEVNKVLMQYKDKGNGYGWHCQNTLVNWDTREVIHYPNDSDFPSHGGSDNINSGRTRTVIGFDTQQFSQSTLEEALRDSKYAGFVKNLTGLRDPSVLVDIGNYFGKPAKVWINIAGTRAAWLGCGDSDFNLDANYDLSNNYAARGVLKKTP